MKIKSFLFYLLALILGGCLPIMSLNPFGTEENIVFEEKLLGIWIEDSNTPESTWEFTRLPDELNGYKLIFTDNDGNKGSFIAALMKIQDGFFLDIFPDMLHWETNDPNQNPWVYTSLFLIPTHTIFKIDLTETKLNISITIDDNFEELLKTDPNAIKYLSIQDKIVLTSTTEELQAFILKYADDEKLFPSEINLVRKSEPEPTP